MTCPKRLSGRAGPRDLRGLFPSGPGQETCAVFSRPEFLRPAGYWSPARTDVMRWVLKPSQFIRPM